MSHCTLTRSADPARRHNTVVGRFDLHATVQVHGAFPELVIAKGLDGQRQQGRPFFGEHDRDLCRLVVPWMRVSAQCASQ
jgi:hypothetical protein